MDPSKPGKHRYATSESNHGQDKTDFPKHVEDPQDSGSSFLPLLSVSAGFLQVFTRCLKKHTLSLKKITPKFLQNNMQDFLPRTFHLFLLKKQGFIENFLLRNASGGDFRSATLIRVHMYGPAKALSRTVCH